MKWRWNTAKYSESYNELILSFVNNINTREGGTHLSGFKTALTRVFNEKLKTSKVGKRSKLTEPLSGEDTRFGLTAVVSAKVPDPQFEGQTKAKLGNTEIKKITETIVYDNLLLYFEQNPDTVEVILSKAVESSMARMAAQRARANVLRKNSLESGSLPGKLADCSEKDPSLCEIYIVEGDSKGGRDSKHQAILPLWGKMLNVEKARIEQVVDNDKLKPVIQALGTNVGKHFNLEKLRYDKVIIMADADVDGSHIRTLLLAFFFRYMTQLIETGHIYLAMPPLYKIEYKKKHYYAYDDNDKDTNEPTLRGGAPEINHELLSKLNERLDMAGLQVIEARINYLAYTPEIAAVMLRRQQASAIISAREKIVEGAVSMVQMALDKLEKDNVVTLDNAQKASMVANLLVVLCADEPAQPVVNASQPKG